MHSPKVSIIIPAYNIENYIRKSIESILQQTYKNFEIIVVDDGSTDNTWNILQSMALTDNRIIVRRQQNSGTASARNKALEYVSGEYITFVDGDDALTSETIENNIKYLIDDLQLDWVSFPIIRVSENNEYTNKKKHYQNFYSSNDKVVFQKDFLRYFYYGRLSGLCCGTLYRWSSVKDIRFPMGEYYEDSFYFCETLWTTKKGILTTQGKYLYLIRNGSSQSAALDYPHLLSTLHSAKRKLYHFKELFPEESEIISKIQDDYYYFFKLYFCKKVPNADIIYHEFCNSFNTPHKRRLLTELKLLSYQVIGYNNIKHLLNLCKKQ